MRVQLIFLTLANLIICSGCATDTGIKTALNSSSLSKMNHLLVEVLVDNEFSMNVAGQRLNSTDRDAILGWGLIGGAVVSGVQHEQDIQQAQNLRQTIIEINLQSLVQKALVDGLQSSHRFTSVTVGSDGTDAPVADSGVLRVRIEEWGLFADKSEDRKLQEVQVGMNVSASLIGGDGKLAWERKYHLTGGARRPLYEFRGSPELLKNELEQTAKRYCATVVNEIRYAQ